MWFKWLLVGIFALDALITIGKVGKDREPISPVEAVGVTILDALLIIGIIFYF
jgi:hypothetical protein